MAKSRVRRWLRDQSDVYAHGEDRPLGGYAALGGLYAAATVTAGALARKLGRRAPERISSWDLAQLTASTFTVSRVLTKSPITSPIRAPFAVYQGVSAPSELHEDVRGHGLRHAAGEMLTCPMCSGQWVATGLVLGLTFAPTLTRNALATLTAVGGADFLHHAYVRLQQATA